MTWKLFLFPSVYVRTLDAREDAGTATKQHSHCGFGRGTAIITEALRELFWTF